MPVGNWKRLPWRLRIKTGKAALSNYCVPGMRKVLVIGVVMAVLQQWCGINVIFNYAQEIFMAAGYGVSDVLMNIVVTGITNVVFTVLAMFVVDRWGRKALTLIGAFGLTVIYAFMGAAYYFHITGVVLLIIVVTAIACYAMTLATTMWVIISEIFPNRVRGVAMSVCTFALWAACFILTYTFPVLNNGVGSGRYFLALRHHLPYRRNICSTLFTRDQGKESGRIGKRINKIAIIIVWKK